MALIYVFSGMTDQQVDQGTKLITVNAPQSIRTPSYGNPGPVKWQKVGHFAGYFSLGFAYLWAFTPHKRRAWVIAILLAAAFALTDEFHQSFVPGRTASLSDVMLDTLAAAAAVLLAVWFPRLKAAWLSSRYTLKRPVG